LLLQRPYARLNKKTRNKSFFDEFNTNFTKLERYEWFLLDFLLYMDEESLSLLRLRLSELEAESIPKNQTTRCTMPGTFTLTNKDIAKGSRIKQEDVFYGIPGTEAGLTSNLFGKYAVMTAVQDIKSNQDLNLQNTRVENPEVEISLIREKILNIIKASGVVVPNNSTLEISHHYGLEEFPNFGSCMITIVNRDYCKKLMISLPGQTHPEMSHREKDETFVVLFGDVELKINGEVSLMQPGDVIAIPPNTTHGYYTKTGCVIEDFSSNHNPNDSFYLDPLITENLDRKTFIKYWI
jgi:mannose-6-phosphate isomerase-like protein (cupin superfamily)